MAQWIPVDDTEQEPPPTRCDVLPEQVGKDLALVLFWCQHYGRQEEMDAAERLIDYFAEPAD